MEPHVFIVGGGALSKESIPNGATKRLLANLKAFFGVTLRDVALDSKPALLICYHI